ncbi:MAG: selenocysteine-specific translation elongation factor [Pseudomonadota bacterium]
MKHIVLGTAGHIDHGKTSLIRALTGVDTDRLAEEKRRGITIELGFASLALPSGQRVAIVDVPGHEKFVKNMVAGATGIDIVAMVIAADEGIMPQTREHLDICGLLSVRHGLVVLTKIDMVDEDWLEMVEEDVRDYLSNTFLADAPLVKVSSMTGQGLEEFKTVLDSLCGEVPERSGGSLFRLPVDRVFTMKGFGTVVTGTLASGSVRVGDPVMIYPRGAKSKVRGIQVHNEAVEEARMGMRTAVNFQGLDRMALLRGDVVAAPDSLRTSYMLDVSLRLLASASKPLKNRARVRVHAGTSEILGNVILLEADELAPGEEGLAQLRLDTPVALVTNDRFVIRGASPVHTLGGGVILNPVPAKHKRLKPGVVESLSRQREAPPAELVLLHVRDAGFTGVSFGDLLLMTDLSAKKLEDTIGKLLSKKELVLADRESRTCIHREVLVELTEKAVRILSDYHKANPLKAGMPKMEVKSRLGAYVPAKVFHLLMQAMEANGAVKALEDLVSLATHEVNLGEDLTEAKEKIRQAYREGGITPPWFKELQDKLGISQKLAKDVLLHLVEEGVLVKVKEDLYFDVQALEELKNRVVDHLKKEGELTPAQFKEMTQASRKYVIPLLEYFDMKKVTLRVGDSRRLREG